MRQKIIGILFLIATMLPFSNLYAGGYLTSSTSSACGTPSLYVLQMTAGMTPNNPSGCYGTFSINLQKFVGGTWGSVIPDVRQFPSSGGYEYFDYCRITVGPGTHTFRAILTFNPSGAFSPCNTAPNDVWTTGSVIFTVTAGAVADFKINNTTVSPTSALNVYGYGCSQQLFTFNSLASGGTSGLQHKLYWKEANSSGTVINSTIYGNNNWTSGLPASSIDMKTYAGGHLGTAAAMNKYWLIYLEMGNSCVSSTIKTGLVKTINASSVPNFSLTAILVADGQYHTYTAPNPPPGPLCASHLTVDASPTTCESHYWVGVQECDVNGNRSYQYEWGKWFSGEAPNNINLQNLATGSSAYWINGPVINQNATLHGGTLAVAPFTARFYRLGICTDEPAWTCIDMIIQVDGNCRIGKVITDQTLSEFSNGIQVFPNPANETVNIKMLSEEKVQSYSLADISGRKIISIVNPESVDNTFSLDVSKFNNGIYLLEVIERSGQKFSSKISVQR